MAYYWDGNRFVFQPASFGGYNFPQPQQSLMAQPPSLMTPERPTMGPGGGGSQQQDGPYGSQNVGHGVQGPVVGPAQDVSNVLSSPAMTGIGLAASLAGVPGIGLAAALGNAAAQASMAPQGQYGFTDFLGNMVGVNTISNALSEMTNDPMGNFRSEQDDAPTTNSQGQNATSTGVNTGASEGLDGTGGDSGSSKIICGELYRQGYLSTKTYMADQQFGRKFAEAEPDAMAGYRFIASPIVRKMKKSFWFSRVVYFIVEPWTRHISGEPNTVGRWTFKAGVAVCRPVGWAISRIDRAMPGSLE